jgi:signal transduction histidine kinase
VANLLGNALNYTPTDGKRIEIEATADAKSVFITVSDNGRGVPRGEQELIFEKFQRGSAAQDGETVGTGLGLAVVRAIVKAHRGKVDVRSDGEQRGSRFCITLPRRNPEAA